MSPHSEASVRDRLTNLFESFHFGTRDAAEVLPALATLEETARSSDLSTELIAQIRTERVAIARFSGAYADALQLSHGFKAWIEPTDAAYESILIDRIEALHHVGRHDEEIADSLAVAIDPHSGWTTVIFTLRRLRKRHPEALVYTDEISDRLRGFGRENDIPEVEGESTDALLTRQLRLYKKRAREHADRAMQMAAQHERETGVREADRSSES